jgi:hypothetical protein
MRAQLRMPAILVFFCFLSLAGGDATAQPPRTFREAVGNERATIVESLVVALFPGAEATWAPNIVLHRAGGEDRSVEFAGFTYRKRADGGFEGATGFEIGNDKEQYIFNASRFRTTGNACFPTAFVVFRAEQGGRVSDFRKFTLDSSDPVSQIEGLELKEWPNGRWPVLRIQYVSYYQQPGSFIAIEWQTLFDSDGGRVTERLPAGIVQSSKDGREEIHTFVAERVDSSRLHFIDSASKTTVDYSCADPCVAEGPRLLQAWTLSQAQPPH